MDNEILKSIKKMFVSNYPKKITEISETLEANNIKQAHILVHNLKSNAGQIGKTFLQKAAAEVEFNLRNGVNNVTKNQLDLMYSELNKVLMELNDEIALYAAPVSDNVQQPAVQSRLLDDDIIRELFSKLEILLGMGSPDCCDYIDYLHKIPGDENLINLLIQQIDDFEFKKAITTLAELKKNINLN